MSTAELFEGIRNNWHLVTFGFAALSGALGYWVRYRMDRQKELASKLTEEQRSIYREFSNIMISMALTSTETPDEKKKANKLVNDFKEVYKGLVVHASPTAIIRVGDFMQYVYRKTDADEKLDTKELLTLISFSIGAMRQDLGLSNWGLGYRSWRLFRPLYRDMDKVMAKDIWFKRNDSSPSHPDK